MLSKFIVNSALALFLCCLFGCVEESGDAAPSTDLGPLSDQAAPEIDLGAEPDGQRPDVIEVSDAGRSDGAVSERDQGMPPCEPALSLAPESGFLAPYDLLTLIAGGGTGNYRFQFSDNQSAAILNELTGAYLAGPNQGVRDLVRLTDVECVGEAMATIHVVQNLAITPGYLEIGFGRSFTYEAEGGSGTYAYEVLNSGSGGVIDLEGTYTAGDREGTDVIRVTDPNSGLEAEVTVSVAENPSLAASPSRLFLPVGSSVPFETAGGSGHFEVRLDEEIATFDEETNLVTATGPGRTTLIFADRFAGVEATVVLDVAASLQAPLTRYGRAQNSNVSLSVGDLNGDGFADAVLGHSEGSQETLSDGVVAVYAGGPMGLSPEPAQVLKGASRSSYFGRSLALADFNGDGVKDLAVGAPNDDLGANDSGAAYVFAGIEGGFFEPTPMATVVGRRSSDLMGQGMAACDFNGDGLADLALVGIGFENREVDDSLRDQGGVFVFLGTRDGLMETPSEILDGRDLNDDGEFYLRPQLRIGVAATAADFDGDNLCDLAVSSTTWARPGERNEGMVQIYRGRAVGDDPEYPDPGGLGPLPSRIIVGAEESVTEGLLGRRLASGDITGDGQAELIIGEHGYDAPEGGNNHGGVRVFLGGALDGPARRYVGVGDADWTFAADNANDGGGIGVGVGHFDDDGVLDLIIGAWADEIEAEEPIGNAGAAHVFLGREGEVPAMDPSFSASGLNGGDQFGESVAILGDVDGDGQGDLMVTAARSHELGVHVGRAYAVGGEDGVVTPLVHPGEIAGHRFGNAVDVADLNGDGLPELIVGAPRSPNPPAQVRAGSVHIFSGQDAFAPPAPPVSQLGGFPDLTRDDNFGFRVNHGDFNGDGEIDLAVASLGEERPNNLGDEYVADGSCRRSSGSGAIYLYRASLALQVENRPSAIYYGGTGGAGGRPIAWSDVNGDSKQDLIVGGPLADGPRDSGRFEVVLGRDWLEAEQTRLLCDPILEVSGEQSNGQLGYTGIGLGDLNGDGCEEFAVSELRRRANEQSDAGVIRVVFGWGGVGCPNRAEQVLISVGRNGEQLGSALAHIPPQRRSSGWLVAGAHRHRRYEDNRRTGGAYLISLDWIAQQTRRPVTNDEAPIIIAERGDDLIPIEGMTNEAYFGASLDVQGELLAIGELYGRYGEARSVGGVHLYHFNGSEVSPAGLVVGETDRLGGRVGNALKLFGDPPRLLVGGFQGGGNGAEAGSAYLFEMDDLNAAP